MKYEMPQIEIIPWPDILRPNEDYEKEFSELLNNE